MPLSRLSKPMGAAGIAAVLTALSFAAWAQDTPAATDTAAINPPTSPAEERHHALSLVGTPKMPADFKHFDWVNPNAPKDGTVRIAAIGGFDSLNPYTPKGVSPASVGLVYDTLMVSSRDEPSTEYGLIAEWVSHPKDFSSATFGLRPEARFNDGTPVTPEDVIFSLEALKKAHPFYGLYFKNVAKVEKTGDHEVTFTFDKCGNAELPFIVGELPILPKHFWDAKDKDGNPRDLGEGTLEVPLGSGPYKIKSFDANRSITYERVADYWAKDLSVTAGQWNFAEINIQYFRDMTPAFEAFKAGQLDYWDESSATAWATNYGFDAVKNGQVKKEELSVEQLARMQAFVFNLRRKQFDDPRVRHAFNLAFNFERAQKTLFYGQYERVESFFGNSELESKGLPEGKELEILTSLKDEVPPEVFTTEWKNPVNNDPAAFRDHLREASKLLQEAGWTLREEKVDDPGCGGFCRFMMSIGLKSATTSRVLRNKDGETLNAEFLLVQPNFQRIVLPYIDDLKNLGINATVRVVDQSQYERREQNFDYDIIVDSFPQSNSPGNEQREMWGSSAADMQGSRNTAGIKNPAIDKLIDKIVFTDCTSGLDPATRRANLVAAVRALDRVLLWNYYVVPQWHNPKDWQATWDIFGRPEKQPSQSVAFLQTWWIDPAKKEKLAAARS